MKQFAHRGKNTMTGTCSACSFAHKYPHYAGLNDRSTHFMRYILLIIAIIAGFLIMKQLYGSRKPPANKKIPPSTTMVRCEHCRVHIPKEEALCINQQYFCSEEHRHLYQSK